MLRFARLILLILPLFGALVLSIFVGSLNVFSLEGSAKVEFLLNSLESAADYKVRMAAANGLGQIADGSLADWMLRAMRKEEHRAVRLAIIYAVGQIPDHRVVPPLIELAHQETMNDEEFLAVERILWNLRAAIATAVWVDTMVGSTDRQERAIAAWLIGIADDRSRVPSLQAAALDASPIVRVRVAQSLGRLGGSEARKTCRSLSERDPEISVRKAAETCISLSQTTGRAALPVDKDFRFPLKTDLYGLAPGSVTPQEYRNYRRKNVNPRAIDVASASLLPNVAERREDRSIAFFRDEHLRETFRMNASVISSYRFTPIDLERLREIVKEEAGYVNRCYLDVQKRNRKLKGSVTLNFKVARTGTVSSLSVEKRTIPSQEVTACIVSRIRKLTFPSLPIDFVTMRYTYTFVPPKDETYVFPARGSAR